MTPDIVKRLRMQASHAPRELVLEAAEKIAWLRLYSAEQLAKLRKEHERLTEALIAELKLYKPEPVEPDYDPGDEEDSRS